MATSSKSRFGLHARLMQQVRPYGLHILGLLCLSLLASPITLMTPLPLKIAVDHVVGKQPLPPLLEALLPGAWRTTPAALLLSAAVMVVAINVLHQLQQLLVSLLSTYTGERIMLGFRGQLFVRAQQLSLTYHDTKGVADSAYRILYDAPAIRDITVYSLIPFLTASITLGGMIYVTAQINVPLAFLALVIAPVLLALHQISRMRLRKQWMEVESREASALSVVNEALGALRVVKAFGQEQHEGKRFMRFCNEGLAARVRFAAVERGLALLMSVATAVGMALVLYAGTSYVLTGAITLGELLLVVAYVTQLYEPLRALTGVAANLQSQLARTERAFALLDEPVDVREKPNARPLRRAAGEITFHNVSFGYEATRPVLQDVSLDVHKGMRVGIIGCTGVGKSTLVNLLTRFYDPSSGAITIDGVDLRDYKLADLRAQFSIVLQEPVLFSTSIAENISYARPGASHEEIIVAARAARIHDFISGLPDGYQTEVGERGMRLSGGERQRLSLARAFLKDAPVLILDEPTSSVDTATEAAIIDSMEHLMAGRTTFLVTHRYSALKGCDIVVRLEKGKLVMEGAPWRYCGLNPPTAVLG